jgi:hypothetical protein
MADKNEAIVPDALPEGFEIKESNKYTIYLRNGNMYTVTSEARSPKELVEWIFSTKVDSTSFETKDGTVTYFHFPEASVAICPAEVTSVEAGWLPEYEEELEEPEEEDYDEDDNDSPRRKKPKKPW